MNIKNVLINLVKQHKPELLNDRQFENYTQTAVGYLKEVDEIHRKKAIEIIAKNMKEGTFFSLGGAYSRICKSVWQEWRDKTQRNYPSRSKVHTLL